MSEKKDAERWLQEALERNLGGMKESKVFIQLWEEGIEKCPIPVLQVGLAVLLDKPVLLVCPPGMKERLSLNLQRLALDILEINMEDREAAQIVALWLKERMELA